MKKIIPEDKSHLKKIIKEEIKLNGQQCDLNHIDVSNMTDMSYLFSSIEFNGDISKWDVSKVLSMTYMFSHSNFNGDIINWDTSSVKDMEFMFYDSIFNQDISKWNVYNVRTMSSMFRDSCFNLEIKNWNVEKVKQMNYMFFNSKFAHDLTDWKPLSLINKFNFFKSSDYNIPYWLEAEYTPAAVRIYMLNEQLNLSLNNNSVKSKIKI